MNGNALAAAIVTALGLLVAAGIAVSASLRDSHDATAADARLAARTVAWSGLNRALVELEASVSGVCSHAAAGDARSCFGNVDGQVDVPSVFDLATNPRGVKNRNLPGERDALDLDGAGIGSDGWIDFRDQTRVRPGVALSRSVAGLYTVRVREEAPGRFRVRAYGSSDGETAGLEALVLRESERPFAALRIVPGGGARPRYRVASLVDVVPR